MPKLRRLSGKDVVRILAGFGFEVVSRHGSHMKLLRLSPERARQILVVPDHAELDKGTLKAIYRQAMRYVPENDLRPHFYTGLK